jgi:sister chromatid cohesion protein DCC1
VGSCQIWPIVVFNSLSLKIKGNNTEDAVLCTADKTYTLRSVVLSNSVLVVSAPQYTEDSGAQTVAIQDQLNEVIELVPTVPKLHKLTTMFKGLECDDQDDISAISNNSHKPGKVCKIKRESSVC